VQDMPLDYDFEQGRPDRYDRAKVVKLFQELEFNSLAGLLPDLEREHRPVTAADAVPQDFRIVRNLLELEAVVAELRSVGSFALDVESTSPLAMTGDLVGLGLSPAAGKAYYVPLAHRTGEQPPKDQALALLKPLLEDPGVQKITHNGKFDMLVLANEGIALRGLASDVIIAAYLAGAKSLNINGQAFERLGMEIPATTGFLGSASKAITMAQAPIEPVAAYTNARASATNSLWPIYQGELKRDDQERLFAEMEMPLLPVLARMEHYGVALDVGALHEMARELTDRLLEVEKQAYDSVGHMFNMGSPLQLSSLLFEELGLPKSKKMKQGYSTDAQVLEGLRGVHPVIESILEYRQVSKLKSTYVDSLPEMVNPRTRRLHTTLSQTVAATGRLSSSDPNLQNIPVRTDLGKRIRDAFVAQRDWMLLSADYSQIELRVLAHMSEDPGLMEAFNRDEDIHAATASQVFNVPIKEVTADQRRFAKVVNFGLVYGMGEFGLATRSDRTREEAAPIIQEYFRKYPGILRYLEDTKKIVREKGYVQTLMGRRRYLPEVHAGNFQVRSAAERMAVNMPVQGTAADIIKIAMINLDKRMEEDGLRSRMVLQVHDELIFEIPMDEMDAMKALVQDLMPHAMELKVPLRVDMKSARTWGEMY
ncbi:MAG: polymerase, partial [Dehalococcoidia bacterium]|nr:polymerase [Dehalococcoidia bacterium]